MHLRFESAKALVPTTFDEHDLCLRVLSEYREMPGLNLTLPQAARLFSLDRTRCARVLSTLVERGALVTNGLRFTRADAGRRSAQ
jgi:hypothetical protein